MKKTTYEGAAYHIEIWVEILLATLKYTAGSETRCISWPPGVFQNSIPGISSGRGERERDRGRCGDAEDAI